MPTLVLKNNSFSALQFLEFARTLPFVTVIEEDKTSTPVLKNSVKNVLKKTERGQNLIVCADADDLFDKLGI